jgi:opacity protein-like surface antigen
VVKLATDQVELPKQEPGTDLMHHHTKVMSTGQAFIEAPKEFGEASFVETRQDLTAWLDTVKPAMKADDKTIEDPAPPPLTPWHRNKKVRYARGGWFADIYLGGSITQSDDLDVRASGFEESSEDVDYDTSCTVGGRLGYWALHFPQGGTALDVSNYQADASGIDTTIYTVSLLAMFRYPGQKIQPYIGIGPGLFITDFELKVDLSAVNPGQTETISDTSVNVGLDTRAGISIQLKRHLALFGEYRFTHHRPEIRDTVSAVNVQVETDYNTHHFVTGVSYRF